MLNTSSFCRCRDLRHLTSSAKELFADTTAKDPPTRKLYDSYLALLAGVVDWVELSETGYGDTRQLALK